MRLRVPVAKSFSQAGSRRRGGRSRKCRLEIQPLEPRLALSSAPLAMSQAGKFPFEIGEIAVAGEQVFFVANDGVHGQELWRTDGTPGGTSLVKDINPGTMTDWETDLEVPAGSFIAGLTAFQGRVFFSAVDDPDQVYSGWLGSLWTSDGTPEGTTMVSTDMIRPRNFTPLGDDLFFLGDRTDDFSYATPLWKYSSGGGVELVHSLNGFESVSSLTLFDGRLFFTAWQDETPALVSIGESGEPEVIRAFPFDSGREWGSWGVEIIGQDSGVLYLSAYDDEYGRELWKSDGTGEGTELVKDIHPGGTSYSDDWDYWSAMMDDGVRTVPNDSYPGDLMPIGGGIALFNAYTERNGAELWRTDGTAAGTVLVKDLAPGSTRYRDSFSGWTTYPNSSEPSGFTAFGGSTYFTTFDGSLWKTDGTAAGTVAVKKIGAKESSMEYSGSVPRQPVVFNGRLFYPAYNTRMRSWELWTSDGTAKGTVPLRDLPPAVTAVSLPDPGTYAAGQTLSFTVSFTGPVAVKGKPTIGLTVGSKARKATYAGGTGTSDLVFTYRVAAGDLDADGIAVANRIVGTVASGVSSKVKAAPALPVLGTSSILVDGVPPVVRSVFVAAGNYVAGDTMAILVTFSETVSAAGSGPGILPAIGVTFGKTVRQAEYVSGSGTDTLRFELVVAEGDAAPKGVRIATTIGLPAGSSISDSFGNVARKLAFKRLATAGVKV